MSNHHLRRILGLLPAVLAILLAGCFGNADSKSGPARIRVLNISSWYDSVDLYTNNGDNGTDTLQFSAVGRSTISDYKTLKADEYTLQFRKTGVSSNLLSIPATLPSNSHQTFVVYGPQNGFNMLQVAEDTDVPNSGYTSLQVLNTTTSGHFDVYLTGADDSLDDVSPALSSIGPSAGRTATVSSGTYRVRVVGDGGKTDLRLDIPSITLASQGVVSLILVAANGGVLVNAVLLPQQGQPTFYGNAASANMRVLNVSSGYAPLDLYTTSSTTDAPDVQQFAGVALNTASDYAPVSADTYALKFRKTGVTGNLLVTGSTVAESSHVTYVAYGGINQFAMLPITEDTDPADAGFSQVQIVNATASDALDIYLSGAGDSLDNLTPTVSAAAAGAITGPLIYTSGTYRLRVTLAGDKTDLRLDVPAITLASTDIVSIVVSESPGGVLVNAVVIPQQGTPAFYINNNVRIRGAVGLSTGSAASLTVGGTAIVTSKPARSYIADTYTILPSGNDLVNVSVDGATVASATRTLAPGMDYTMLIWDTAGVPQITLLPDDNRLDIKGEVKLRLINGMSGLGAPLNLSIDFAPVAEYVVVGAASDYFELEPSTINVNGYHLDLLNAQTLDALISRDSVLLQAKGVYTFFAAGGGSSSVAGTLRKDH
ncbi:MAG TPA: DUF4397 domain-containing protein [Steroidobacteraceae bacterium]|nr:DUF4397 domain-containing protein [Steroidobacteraceae bacterium]